MPVRRGRPLAAARAPDPAAGRASAPSRVAVRDELLHRHRLVQRWTARPASSPGSSGSSRGSPGWCRAPTRRRDEALALHAAHDRAAPLRLRLDQRRPLRRARLIGLGAVVCFHYPSIFTVPELRALYPLPYVRALLHLVLVGAFLLGAISVTLRRNKALGVAASASRWRGAARRLAGAGRRRAGTRPVPRPGLVPAESDRLLGAVRPARAAVRAAAGADGVPAGVAHRPDLLRSARCCSR